jgi:probable rRNA maturation factor
MNEEISIQITDRFLAQVDPLKIKRAIDQAINHVAASMQVSLTVVFEEDERLQQLNKQYLGIDAPTDVLSFPADYLDPETKIRYLGDILISVPRALEQATSGGHSLDEELQLLVVHGILHLLGYDHVEDGEKEVMQETQSAILHQLGIELSVDL